MAGGGTRVTLELFMFLQRDLKSLKVLVSSFPQVEARDTLTLLQGLLWPFRALIFHLKIFNSKDPKWGQTLGFTGLYHL